MARTSKALRAEEDKARLAEGIRDDKPITVARTGMGPEGKQDASYLRVFTSNYPGKAIGISVMNGAQPYGNPGVNVKMHLTDADVQALVKAYYLKRRKPTLTKEQKAEIRKRVSGE